MMTSPLFAMILIAVAGDPGQPSVNMLQVGSYNSEASCKQAEDFVKPAFAADVKIRFSAFCMKIDDGETGPSGGILGK